MEIGFRYGSLVEDYFTGYRLHCEGWKSVLCDPTRPTFIGEAPINIQDVLTQLKRWVVGLLEVAFSKYFPLCYGVRRISLLMSMCYAYHTCWPSWFIPMFIYGIIPQLALLYQVPLFPKASDPWFILCCYLFAASYAQDFIDFLRAGGNPRQWWNEQRVWMIRGVTCFPLGIIEFTLKELGISIGGFEITNKVVETEQRERYEKGLLEFGVTSPITVSITTFSLISLTAFIVAVLRAFVGQEDICTMAVQIFISGFVTATCLPIYHTMFIREDSGKMPGLVVLMSTSIVGILYTIGYFVFIS